MKRARSSYDECMAEEENKMDAARPRKIDRLAENLDDLTYNAEELKDELGDAPNEALDDLQKDLEAAKDLVDEIGGDEDN
jgi:hypothetical protein